MHDNLYEAPKPRSLILFLTLLSLCAARGRERLCLGGGGVGGHFAVDFSDFSCYDRYFKVVNKTYYFYIHIIIFFSILCTSQTPKNDFQSIFRNATKYRKTCSFQLKKFFCQKNILHWRKCSLTLCLFWVIWGRMENGRGKIRRKWGERVV